ncbi:MAG: 50S ribosomal protein L11 methyltransferase [Actinomycetota bacterium]|nr:50S ribosomal protein L11 methyltransferase [Actinomycetota bacterium]MEC8924243.1 50S ribosomal protein L11 methyltransferase [Actinomycetota bacterium]
MTGQVVVAADALSKDVVEDMVGIEGEWELLRSNRWVAWYEVDDEEVARNLVADLRGAGHPAVAGPPDEARAVAWRKRNRPTSVGERAEVCFPWVNSSAEIVIEIDPGGGFGTGDHPSTRLLLEELASNITGDETVLDVGCGSGVLAIAAVCFGASRATGIDIDAVGLAAAETNARRNRISDRTQFSSTPLKEISGSYDVVVANIHDEVLRAMADGLVSLLSEDGWLGLSGVSPGQLSRLRATFPKIIFEEPRQMQDWNALIGRRQIE